ncbi:MAG: hypothetical protein EON48_12155 [Acetobacteraceae bacterium]|nr:MAG: hypothetical protein EON48_12155 [Acetobacteraceae bacterium]
MSKKSLPDADDPRVVLILDQRLLKKINQLAADYGIDPEEVIRELIKMETLERPKGTTLH